MFISKSKAQCVGESSCLMFVNYDGHAADADHQRQQRRHILYVVYVSLHGRHALFAMPAMFGALAAEVL